MDNSSESRSSCDNPLTSAGNHGPDCVGNLAALVAPTPVPAPVAAPARARTIPGLRPAAIRVGLAGLLAAVAFAGCGGGSTSSRATSIANQQSTAPIATPRTNTQSAEPTTEPSHGPTGFSPTGSMTIARQNETATRLQDGRVLIAGGESADAMTLIASAELYDPATGKFNPTGSMQTAREYHTATLLSDGRALITGGYVVHPGSDDATLASAELYDPATGKFSATASIKNERRQHTATLLSDGRVLIAGGEDESETALASTELYDPEAGKFSPAGSLAQARFYHTATRLSDGRVLIAGGDDESGLASAELYQP